MRFFKFGGGEVLAIALPASLQKSANVREADEYEFIDLGEGAFLLVSRSRLDELAKRNFLSKLGEKLIAPAASDNASESVNKTASDALVQDSKQAEAQLEKNGFVVVDEAGAKSISQALESKIKQGEVLGVRGFDRRYYVLSRGFYEDAAKKIRAAASGETNAREMAQAIKTSEEAAVAVLQVLKEQGEAIEKRRGVFKLVS